MKKNFIVGGAITLIIIILGSIFVNKTRKNEIALVEKNMCLVQYNSCHFIKDSLEPWDKKCEPINGQYSIENIGEHSLLVKDLTDGKSQIISKQVIKNKINEKLAASESASFIYTGNCSEKVVTEKQDNQEKDKKEIAVIEEDITDKCIILKNNCNKERWDEDKDKACPEIKHSFKVMEVGSDKIRVVIWNGHSKKGSVGSEEILDKKEFISLGYEVKDCFELMNKYSSIDNKKVK